MTTRECPHGCGFSGTPGEMFEHFKDSHRHYAEHGRTSSVAKQVALAVGVKDYSSGFPRTSGTFEAGGLRVVVRPAAFAAETRRGKSSAHRVFVECPTCSPPVLVPAGRLGQHKHRTLLGRARRSSRR